MFIRQVGAAFAALDTLADRRRNSHGDNILSAGPWGKAAGMTTSRWNATINLHWRFMRAWVLRPCMEIIAEPYGKPRKTDLPSTRIDTALPFQIHDLGVPRRVVKLTAAPGSVLGTGRYPPAVAEHLGETLALAAPLASALKYDSGFSLQIQGDGSISLMITDTASEGDLRAYVKFNEHVLNNGHKATDTSGVVLTRINDSTPSISRN